MAVQVQPPVPAPYLTYLSLGEHCLTLAFKLVALSTMGTLAFLARFRPHKLRSKISHSMALYLTTHVLCVASSVPYQAYSILWWQLPAYRQPGKGTVFTELIELPKLNRIKFELELNTIC